MNNLQHEVYLGTPFVLQHPEILQAMLQRNVEKIQKEGLTETNNETDRTIDLAEEETKKQVSKKKRQ